MKNPNNPIVNRTRNLPACIAVPQPTAPPRTTVIRIEETRDLCGILMEKFLTSCRFEDSENRWKKTNIVVK
jgi:hypothetical protein